MKSIIYCRTRYNRVRELHGKDAIYFRASFSDDLVWVWNIASGKVRKRIGEQHPGDVGIIAIAPGLNGQFGMLSGGNEESLLIWCAGRLEQKTSAGSNREFGEILVWDPSTLNLYGGLVATMNLGGTAAQAATAFRFPLNWNEGMNGKPDATSPLRRAPANR